MANKIFISYKYDDSNVHQRLDINTTVRTYVNLLEETLKKSNHICKGEPEKNDLSNLQEDEIWEELKPRIYDSTITIVIISPYMKNNNKIDREQWIPWEISYSLRNTTRKDRTSATNAMLAVVLPDRNNSYDYCVYKCVKCENNCDIIRTDILFEIINRNCFNNKKTQSKLCSQNNIIYQGKNLSYIPIVKWDEFIKDYSIFLEQANEIKKNIDDYKIVKEI